MNKVLTISYIRNIMVLIVILQFYLSTVVQADATVDASKSITLVGAGGQIVDYLGDGSRLLTVGKKTACVWNTSNGHKIFPEIQFTCDISAETATKNGELVAISAGKSVEIWSINKRAKLKVLTYPKFVNDISINPDGTILAVACDDNQVHLSKIETGEEISSLSQPNPAIKVGFSSNGSYLFAIAGKKAVPLQKQFFDNLYDYVKTEGDIQLWRIEGYQVKSCWKLSDRQPGVKCKTSAVFSGDGKYIVVGTFHSVLIINVTSGEVYKAWNLSSGNNGFYIFDQDAKSEKIVAAGDDGLGAEVVDAAIRVFDFQNNERESPDVRNELHQIASFCPNSEIGACKISPNARYIAEIANSQVKDGEEMYGSVFELKSSRKIMDIRSSRRVRGQYLACPRSIAFSPNSSTLAVGYPKTGDAEECTVIYPMNDAK